jgi:hypothetical protein
MSTPTQRFGFTLFARDQASPVFDQVGQAAGQLNARMAAAAAAIGVSFAGLGALVSESFTAAFDQLDIKSKLQAQLGTTDAVAKRQGEIAGSLYSHGIADSFQQAADAIKTAAQSGLVPPDATNKQLESISKKALDLANVFGQDMPRVTNAAAQMIRTGLVKDSTEAFDVLTRGFQTGANKADDLLDTVNEYGTQFRKAGLDGAEAMGLLSQAIRAGARDSDIAADAIKEFSIRAVDGSTLTADGFKMLGLNADEMARKFAEGGAAANGVLDLTLDRLRGIEDPVKRSQAAVALFGTQAEDLGEALFAMDPSKAVDTLGRVEGAAAKMGKTIHSGPRHEIEVFKRTVEQNLVNFFGNTAIPAVAGFTRVVGDMVPIEKIKRGFSDAKETISDFFAGLRGQGTVDVSMPRVDQAPQLLPKSSAAQIGQQIRDAVTGGIRGINWGEVGSSIGSGLANAMQNAGEMAAKLTIAFGSILAKIDWVGLGIAIGKFVPSLLVGFVVGLINFDIAGMLKGLADHWQEVLLSILFLAFLPAKWVGAIGQALAKIPFLGRLLSWGFGIFTRFSKWLVGWAGKLLAGFGRGILQGLGRIFPGAARAIGDWAGRFSLAIVAYAGRLGEAAIRLVRGIGPGLIRGAEGLGRFTVRVIEAIVRRFAGAGRWLWDHGVALVRGLGRGISNAARGFGSWVMNRVGRPAIDAFKNAGSWLLTRGRDTVVGLKNGIVNGVRGIGGWATRTIVQPVTSRFVNAGSWLLTRGRQTVSGLKNGVINGVRGIGAWATRTIVQPVTSRFTNAGSWLLSRGRQTVTGLKNGIVNGARGVGSWTNRNVISPVTSRFTRAGTWLTTRGRQLISGLKSGIVGAVKGIGSWIKRNLIDPIVGAVKRHFGIRSPSTVFAWIGKHLVGGLVKGLATSNGTQIAKKIFGDMPSALGSIVSKGLVSITSLPGKALRALGSLGSKLGGIFSGLFGGGGGGKGVQQWAPLVSQVLAMLGAPASALGPVLKRIQMESGGNPRAINLWDINAKNGDPSRGLMQTIGSTFNAYAGPFKGRGIYDPLANIYAGINYAMNRYGQNWINVMTRPGGYDNGGMLPPGLSLTYNGMGISEPAAVFTPPQWDTLRTLAEGGAGGAVDVHVHFDDPTLKDLIRVTVEPKIRKAQDEAAYRQKVGRRHG